MSLRCTALIIAVAMFFPQAGMSSRAAFWAAVAPQPTRALQSMHHNPAHLPRPTMPPRAMTKHHKPVLVPPAPPPAPVRLSGPKVDQGSIDARHEHRQVPHAVRKFRRLHDVLKAPSVPGRSAGRLGAAGSTARRTATVDVSQPNVTGINHWWSYEEGSIPGVGRYMVNLWQQNLILQSDDLDVLYRGIDLAFRRTYNSYSGHDYAGTDGSVVVGQFGNGWTNTFDAHMTQNSAGGMSIYDIDGARYDYSYDGAGNLLPPTGMEGTSLVTYDGGSFFWTKKSGTQYAFYAPYYPASMAGYNGRIFRISGRNRNSYIQFAYAWDGGDASTSAHLNQISATTDSGMSALLQFGDFNGRRLCSFIEAPDNQTFTWYGYDADGNLQLVRRMPNSAGGNYRYESYGGYKSFLWVASPRLNATASGEGGYPAFHFVNGNSAQLDGVQFVGTLNFAPPDGTGTYLQPGAATGEVPYRWQPTAAGPGYTSVYDTDGHEEYQFLDAVGRPTIHDVYSGSNWLQTSEAWDAHNHLTATVDARGNETDYAYDGNGNAIAVAGPPVTTSQGTFRPTSLYDYDANNNVVAYCDPVQTHQAGADWSAPPAQSDSLCSSRAGAVPHWQATFSYPSYEPFGQIQSMSTPLGYTRRFSYAAGQQGGTDYGLPTSVSGDTITQLDGSTLTPAQSFWYDARGNLRCYDKGRGAYVLSYDALGRLTSEADPDDSSANATSFCGKSTGRAGWNTQTTTTYNPDGSKQSSQTPSERSFSVSTTYTYDANGNVVTETAHHGCVPNQPCVEGTTRKWYDGADRLVEVAQPQDTRSFSDPALPYDGDRWITRQLYDLTAGNTVSVTGSAPFHAYGNLYKTQSYITQGTTSTWTDVRGSAFDPLDRETSKFAYSVGPNQLTTATLQYDLDATTLGLLARRTNPNNESTIYSYDSHGHVATQTYAGDGGVTPSETYVYDPNGRPSSVTSSQYGAQSYAYDGDGRLITSIEPSGGGMTSAAQISYGYYGNGSRASVSVASSGLTQPNALSYSYRADGVLQTQAVNAFSSGTWSKQYTDAGRLSAISGADTQNRTYDATGQAASFAVPAGTATYTRDPEGSVLTENYSNLGPPGSANPENITNTLNVRGELVDRGEPPGPQLHTRSRNFSGCFATTKYPYDWADYIGVTDPTADGSTCDKINGVPVIPIAGIFGDYATFDATGRETVSGQTKHTTGDAAGPRVPPQRITETQSRRRRTLPAGTTWTGTYQTTVTRGYDAENHLHALQWQITDKRTNLTTGQTTTTTSGPSTVLPIGWGPNGHPLRVANYFYNGLANRYLTLHWDGDTILFVSDDAGNVVDFRIGLDGDITPRDPDFSGLTVYDRDAAGVIVQSSNATGTTGFNPVDPSFASGGGVGGTAGFRSPAVPAQYARSDGFVVAMGIQINGVRAFDSTLGVWSTPDAYEGDVHDPASQQRYMWNRGNAIDYSDPSGYDAIVSRAGNIVQIILLVNFVGGTDGQRQMIKSAIEQQWTGTFGDLVVKTRVITGAKNSLNYMNTIYIQEGGPTHALQRERDGHATTRQMRIDPVATKDHDPIYGAKHEGGHLLGAEDMYEPILNASGRMIASLPFTGFGDNVMGANGKAGVSEAQIWEILQSPQNYNVNSAMNTRP